MMHLSSLCSLYSPRTYDVIVVINLRFSFSAGIPGLVLWCFFPLFPVLSTPSRLRQMAGEARRFFILKGSFFFPPFLSAVHAQDGGLVRSFYAIYCFLN